VKLVFKEIQASKEILVFEVLQEIQVFVVLQGSEDLLDYKVLQVLELLILPLKF
jgi:hypothetical protein